MQLEVNKETEVSNSAYSAYSDNARCVKTIFVTGKCICCGGVYSKQNTCNGVSRDCLGGNYSYAVSVEQSNDLHAYRTSVTHLLSLAPGTDTTCVTFNKHGTINKTETGQVLEFWIAFNPILSADHWLALYINEPGERYHLASKKITWIRFGSSYEVDLKTTRVFKLGAPYSSCIKIGSEEAAENNLFGGRYTASKCFETCNLRDVFNKCGNVSYGYQNFLNKYTTLSDFCFY